MTVSAPDPTVGQFVHGPSKGRSVYHVGYELHWSSKPEIWGLLFLWLFSEVREPDLGYKYFASQGEVQGFELPPSCKSLHWGWGL